MKRPPEKINPALEAAAGCRPRAPLLRLLLRLLPGGMAGGKSGREGRAGYSVCNRL